MKNKQKNELAVCGFAAVKTLEKQNLQKIKRLYFSKEKSPLFGGLCKKLASKKIPYNQVEEKELEKLCKSVHHQGVVAMIDEIQLPFVTKEIIYQWVKNKENAILLDRIGNANNFGAIIRSAAFFGIKNIIIPEDDSVRRINSYAFQNCSTLTEIKIPKNITSIGKFALNSCNTFDYINVPSIYGSSSWIVSNFGKEEVIDGITVNPTGYQAVLYVTVALYIVSFILSVLFVKPVKK